MLQTRGRKLSDWLKKHFVASRSEGDSRYAASPNQGVRENSVQSGLGAPVREGTGRERRRRRRRRASIVGLPIYSEDPADAEMTLFKHRPSIDSRSFNGSASQIDLLDYDQAQASGSTISLALARTITGGTAGGSGEGALDLPDSPVAMRGRSSTVDSIGYSSVPSLHPPLYGTGGSSRTSSAPISITTATSALTASRPRHISTHSSPLNIPSSSSLTTSSTSAMAGRPATGRNRASTFRSIFTRDEEAYRSEIGARGGRGPYGPGGSGATRSVTSLAGLSISAPLQHTLVSSSFIFPRAGISPSQIAFISSRESLGAFGYGPGESPPSFPFGPPSPTSSVGSNSLFAGVGGAGGGGGESGELGVGRWGTREDGLGLGVVEGRGRRSSSVSASPLRFIAHSDVDPSPIHTHTTATEPTPTHSHSAQSSSSASGITSPLPELEELRIETGLEELEIPEVFIDTPSAVENEVQGAGFTRSITA